MKNDDIKSLMRFHGIEWIELSRFLNVPLKDLVRRLNNKQLSPTFRRRILDAIESISQRPEDFYDEWKL